MTKRTIELHYDLISPFAHVVLARLDELPGDVTVKPVPVLLGAILNHWGQRGPAEISAKRLHTYRQSVFLGKQFGVDLRFPPRHPFNPLKALRLTSVRSALPGRWLAVIRSIVLGATIRAPSSAPRFSSMVQKR